MEIAALDALSEVGHTVDVSEALVPKLESGEMLIQEAALKAYAQYLTPDNYKHLKTLWYDEDERIRRTAFVMSELFMNETDLEDLKKAVKSKDEFIASQARVMINAVTPDD